MSDKSVNLLEYFKSFVQIGWDKYTLDDVIFRLHTKVTVSILVLFALVTVATQLLGDPINCIVEEIPTSLMDTYCWIHSTFTLPGKILDKQEGETAHPGVGVPDYESGEVTYHKYYQWVGPVLIFQALLFIFPRFLWHKWEKQRLANVFPDYMFISVPDGRMPRFPKPAMAKSEMEASVEKINDFLAGHIGKKRYRGYFLKYQLCEWLNLFNVIFQLVFLDVFFNGMFSTYGSYIWNISNLDPEDRADPMNLVFPKVAKCTFVKQGPSGSIQNFDGLCVLPINIFNEKIYCFLFFWLVFLAFVSCIGLIYRLTTILFTSIRAELLRLTANMLIPSEKSVKICSAICQSDWFFLTLIGANMEPRMFASVLSQLEKLLAPKHNRLGNGTSVNLEKTA